MALDEILKAQVGRRGIGCGLEFEFDRPEFEVAFERVTDEEIGVFVQGCEIPRLKGGAGGHEDAVGRFGGRRKEGDLQGVDGGRLVDEFRGHAASGFRRLACYGTGSFRFGRAPRVREGFINRVDHVFGIDLCGGFQQNDFVLGIDRLQTLKTFGHRNGNEAVGGRVVRLLRLRGGGRRFGVGSCTRNGFGRIRRRCSRGRCIGFFGGGIGRRNADERPQFHPSFGRCRADRAGRRAKPGDKQKSGQPTREGSVVHVVKTPCRGTIEEGSNNYNGALPWTSGQS